MNNTLKELDMFATRMYNESFGIIVVNTDSSANPIDNSSQSDIIKSTTTSDGGPGSGRYPKGSGNSKYSEQAFRKALIGKTTCDGRRVKSINGHLFTQNSTRNVYPENIQLALKKGTVSKGNKPNRLVYSHRGTRVIYDTKEDQIVTLMYRSEDKQKSKGSEKGKRNSGRKGKR